MRLQRSLLIAPAMLLLASCGGSKEPADEVQPKASKPTASNGPVIAPIGTTLGTPMAERVAILGLLNKRNGQTRDIEIKPGQDIRLGKVFIRLRACEKTAPWETYPDQGAFVQVYVRERPPGTTEAERFRQVFSGWLFKENPAANVVQHPVYDVWIKECRMSFPGEEAIETKPSAEGSTPDAPKKPSSTPQSAPDTTPAAPAEPDEVVPEDSTIET
jgi:hypothetical protein